jgi:hypothetical protein
MICNPLLFCPSPRDIPEVRATWDALPYDKYVVKKRLEPRAYQDGRNYFLRNKEYTHLVVCPDDMEVSKDSFYQLLWDIVEYDYPTIAGLSNIDEDRPTVYSAKPKKFMNYSLDHTPATKGSLYSRIKETYLPKDPIFEAGFSGFACQIIRRDLMEKVSFTGSCNNGTGCMDWKFTQECHKLGIKQMVDQRAFFFHRRRAQYREVMAWKKGPHTPDEGSEYLIKAN